MKTRPNIVFVLADQLRYQSCGYAGDALAHTPNLDKLAAESVNVKNMVSSMPVCAAYRASLFTGKYATSTGMVINEIRLNPDHHRCLAQCLAEVGYNTSYIGKWHMYANEFSNHADPRNSFIPPGKHRLGFDGYFAAYNFRHRYYAPAAYYHLDTPVKIFLEDGLFEPDFQTDLAIDQIQSLSKDNRPFLLVLSLGTPHDPWVKNNVPSEYYEMYRNVVFPLPEDYSDTNPDPYGDAWSDAPKTAGQLQEWMRIYYAMTANLDWNVGRLLQTVTSAGLQEDTMFIFTSDHGEMFGAHGRMKKNIFYEEAARVPFLLRWPARCRPMETDVCASNVDILPTLLGTVGADIPNDVEGMDLSHILFGRSGDEPEAAFLQNTGACATWEDGHEWRALRNKRFTYAVFRVDGKEYLFDNVTDPHQLQNLAGDPACSKIIAAFRKMLREKMTSLQDSFPPSSYYRQHWISNDRRILRTATSS